MKLTELKLTDFRNIAAAHFTPAPELTVICGENGQGKTNLLEGVWLQTGAKSFRGAKDVQLVRENAAFAVLESVIETQTDTQQIRISIGGAQAEKQGRYAKINGVEYGRATAIAGRCTAVVFAPVHLSLVKGSPDGRRKFMDAALCQIKPAYITLLRQYTRIVSQKNALLKSYFKTQGGNDLLDVFDEKLAEAAVQIITARQTFLQDIKQNTVHNYSDISAGREQLQYTYECSCDEVNVASSLRAARQKDIAAGFCTTGPHRDDLFITIDGRDARVYASQGQQRSAVLSLKLAEAANVKQATGEHPIMLLDDVLSELDAGRQAYLLNRMQGKQTIVTTCDAHPFLETNGKLVQMADGALTEV